MKEIKISNEHFKFIENQAPKLDIGGFSNLDRKDLTKASRLDYQYTGLYGELAWYMHRYNSFDKLSNLLDYKFEVCRKNNIGDSGYDDSITHNEKTRFVDIKTTHIDDEKRIKYLNLVIPPRELHEQMIYICAFSIGKDRKNVDKVILAGWEINECITDRWKYDSNKYCVSVPRLRPMKELEKYIR